MTFQNTKITVAIERSFNKSDYLMICTLDIISARISLNRIVSMNFSTIILNLAYILTFYKILCLLIQERSFELFKRYRSIL